MTPSNAFGLFCSIYNSTPTRDSISIRPVPGAVLTFDDSSGKEHITDSSYFIIIDTADEFSYELWQIPVDTGKKFIIPFDTDHFFKDYIFIVYLFFAGFLLAGVVFDLSIYKHSLHLVRWFY